MFANRDEMIAYLTHINKLITRKKFNERYYPFSFNVYPSTMRMLDSYQRKFLSDLFQAYKEKKICQIGLGLFACKYYIEHDEIWQYYDDSKVIVLEIIRMYRSFSEMHINSAVTSIKKAFETHGITDHKVIFKIKNSGTNIIYDMFMKGALEIPVLVEFTQFFPVNIGTEEYQKFVRNLYLMRDIANP
jgi:hypothetical protein